MNLHFSQKLCWQQGIITASLNNVLQREHLSSDGKLPFSIAEALVLITLKIASDH